MGPFKRPQKIYKAPDSEKGHKALKPTTRIFRKWGAPLQPGEGGNAEKRREKGYTLLETLGVVTLLSFVTVALFSLFGSANSLFRAGDVKADIEEQGRIALMNIAEEMKETGYYTAQASGKSYPYIFADGAPVAPFLAYAHTPALHQAESGTAAFGPTREIVFRMAQDLDGDGYKTSSATGKIEWGPDEIAYVLVTAADGVNQIERRVNNASPKVVARFVERLCFDNMSTDASVPYGQIRVTLHLRKMTSNGRIVKAVYSTLVKMRNYEE